VWEISDKIIFPFSHARTPHKGAETALKAFCLQELPCSSQRRKKQKCGKAKKNASHSENAACPQPLRFLVKMKASLYPPGSLRSAYFKGLQSFVP
jgi:hypothetical protein